MMDRVDQIRAARSAPHVSFTEYVKLRSKCRGTILVFEGKQCPSVYMTWLASVLRKCGTACAQIIARGKRNVLALRDLIQRNLQTRTDQNIYFVDKDFDVHPTSSTYPDVYVTRGYSIENEVIDWGVVESFLRAYFDIADSDDQDAVEQMSESFDAMFAAYLQATRELQQVIFVCRRRSFACVPGDNVFSYVEADWAARRVVKTYASLDELLARLQTHERDRVEIRTQLAADAEFEGLNPPKDWRGKFHFSFVRAFLLDAKERRSKGVSPFKRPSRVSTEPAQPGLLGGLSSLCAPPKCLMTFVEAQLGRS